MWDRIFKALQKYGLQARDARINAIGVDNIRDLHKDGKTEEANKLTNDLYKAHLYGINLTTGYAFSPEKVDPTLNFYKWKLKHLLKPEVEVPDHLKDHYKYLMSVEIPHNEGATNVLELGLFGNLRKARGYPGGVKLQKMLDEIRNSNINHRYTIDLLNMKKPKRVWEALTGQYQDGGKLTDDDYKNLVGKYLKWNVSSADELAHLEKKLKEV